VEAADGSRERALVRLRTATAALGACVAIAAGASTQAGSSATAAVAGSPAASASDRYEGEWAYRVRPWQRRPVVSVTVAQAGLGDDQRDAASEPEPCRDFRPTEQQIRAYFARARRVGQRGFLHESDWSACHATGELRLRGGQRAEWMVQRLGAGYLSIDGARYYFDCERCALGDVGRRGSS